MQYADYYQVWPHIMGPRRQMQIHDLGLGGIFSPHRFANEPVTHVAMRCGAQVFRVFAMKWGGYVETPMYFDVQTHEELHGPCTCGATRGLAHENELTGGTVLVPNKHVQQYNFVTQQYETRPGPGESWRDFLPQDPVLLAAYDTYQSGDPRAAEFGPYFAACHATDAAGQNVVLPDMDYRPPFARAWDECYAAA